MSQRCYQVCARLSTHNLTKGCHNHYHNKSTFLSSGMGQAQSFLCGACRPSFSYALPIFPSMISPCKRNMGARFLCNSLNGNVCILSVELHANSCINQGFETLARCSEATNRACMLTQFPIRLSIISSGRKAYSWSQQTLHLPLVPPTVYPASKYYSPQRCLLSPLLNQD